MRVSVLSCGSAIVESGDQRWLLGAPAGVVSSLKESGLVIPATVLLTSMRSPGMSELSDCVSYKEQPVSIGGLSATPTAHKHGTDLVIEDGDAKVLFSERGDVATDDTDGYDLAIVKNKHRSDNLGEHVITWPWMDIDMQITNHAVEVLGAHDIEAVLKVWSSADDVPDNLKSLDGASLTLGQANQIARVAKASGSGDEENWAIAISQFKKGHTLSNGRWVTKEYVEGLGPRQKLGDMLVSTVHSSFTAEADYLYREGYMNESERIRLSNAIGDALKSFRGVAPQEVMDRVYGTYMPPEIKAPVVLPKQLKELIPGAPDEVDQGWTTVYKDGQGVDRWATVTAVSMWDRQQEFLTHKALDWAINFAKVVGPGPLRFRHVPGLDGGDCDSQVRVGDFLFESGTFRDTDVGLAMKELLRSAKGYRVSPGLMFGPQDLVDGEYGRVIIFERSITLDPVIPATATIAITNKSEDGMKTLTKDELIQVAKELGLDISVVENLHRQALDGLTTVAGFKEYAYKAAKVATENQESDDTDTEDTEDVESTEESVEDGEEGDNMSKVGKEDRMAALAARLSSEQRAELLSVLGAPVGGNDAGMADVLNAVKELAGQVAETRGIAERALKESAGGVSTDLLLEAIGQPRKKAQYVTKEHVERDSDGEDDIDAAIFQKLQAIEEKVKEAGGSVGNGSVYNSFTSTRLNKGDE